jgi:hypothetical protein
LVADCKVHSPEKCARPFQLRTKLVFQPVHTLWPATLPIIIIIIPGFSRSLDANSRVRLPCNRTTRRVEIISIAEPDPHTGRQQQRSYSLQAITHHPPKKRSHCTRRLTASYTPVERYLLLVGKIDIRRFISTSPLASPRKIFQRRTLMPVRLVADCQVRAAIIIRHSNDKNRTAQYNLGTAVAHQWRLPYKPPTNNLLTCYSHVIHCAKRHPHP